MALRLTEFQEKVLEQLDSETWKNLREIAEGCGEQLAGSGWENTADSLVELGHAEVRRAHRHDVWAPMGKVYRRTL